MATTETLGMSSSEAEVQNDTVGGSHFYSTTGIVARGRLYVAGDNRVYAFNLRPDADSDAYC